jgi:hypothetical protein
LSLALLVAHRDEHFPQSGQLLVALTNLLLLQSQSLLRLGMLFLHHGLIVLEGVVEAGRDLAVVSSHQHLEWKPLKLKSKTQLSMLCELEPASNLVSLYYFSLLFVPNVEVDGAELVTSWQQQFEVAAVLETGAKKGDFQLEVAGHAADLELRHIVQEVGTVAVDHDVSQMLLGSQLFAITNFLELDNQKVVGWAL